MPDLIGQNQLILGALGTVTTAVAILACAIVGYLYRRTGSLEKDCTKLKVKIASLESELSSCRRDCNSASDGVQNLISDHGQHLRRLERLAMFQFQLAATRQESNPSRCSEVILDQGVVEKARELFGRDLPDEVLPFIIEFAIWSMSRGS